ncbi:hypothetical protein PQX77_022249 [Marasmius sp. AFHP31]|nr:hypothetical protein PQX77_022249 [Marasmius sp. AFHP31]
MSTQATTNATLESLLTRLVNQQQSQQAQLDAIRDTFKANKDEGAVIAKPAAFKGDADDVARFLPMFRNWATEQKALRIKAGPGVPPADVGKLDHRRTIQSALSFCEGGKAGRWAANYLKQIITSMTDESVAFPFEGRDPKDLDDLEDWSCRAERALEAEGFSTRRRTETHTTTISATVPTHATQTNPVGGNGKTREDFMRAMRNRCYGCGATDHTKAQGNHGQEQCHHCKRFGHRTSVCQDKFLGRMPGLGLRPARVARINSAVPFTLFPGETVNIGASPPAPTATIASTVPSTQASTSYTPSSDAVARIAALQDSLNQQNAMIQQLMGQKDF